MDEQVQAGTDIVEKKVPHTHLYKILNIFFVLCGIALLSYYLFSAPPEWNNTHEVNIHIGSKDTFSSVSRELETRHIVRYAFVLRVWVVFLGGNTLRIGDYHFIQGSPVWKVAWQLARGKHNVIPIRMTIREGMTNIEITELLSQNISAFRRDLFTTDTRYKQGYLFPDTYFFFPLSTTDEILSEMTSAFEKRIKPMKKDIEASKYSLDQIITMASIVEKEANGEEDASVIAGILWKRLSIGMALQADASPVTYKEAGLPKEPIGNPGLVSIRASVYPTESPYLYYLHDKNGGVHYAKTFEEHKRNIQNYLR